MADNTGNVRNEDENHFVGVNYMEPLTTEEENLFLDLLRCEIDGTREDHCRYIGIDGERHPDLPYVVAIGPLSKERKMQNSKDVGRGESLKVEYLKAFLNRTDGMSLASCVGEMKKWESRAYEFYNYSIDTESLMRYSLTRNPRFVFLEMLLLDSCFVLEVIWRYNTGTRGTDEGDRLSSPGIILDARRDIILLDNQLPFFFLEALFNLAFNPSNDRKFINLCITYLRDFMLIVDSSQAHENIRRQKPTEIKHFVDLLRICHAPSLLRQPPEDSFTIKAMPTATQLDGAGMVIEPSLSEIQHSSGRLHLPKIKINDKSEFVLKSLVQLELREYQYDSYIINYLHFMDGLINTGKDVDILVENQVIQNYLHDSKAVATLFNKITAKTTLYAKNYYSYGISEKLNAYCKAHSNRWMATLLCDYGSSTWMIVSSIAAGILLVITLIQIINSMIYDLPINKG